MGYKTTGSSRASAKSAVASSIVVANSDGGFKLSGSSVTAQTSFAAEVVSPGQASVVATLKSTEITNVIVTDSSYNNLDDTDINNATGGYAKIIGRGFIVGAVVYLNGTAVTSTFVNSTEIRITVPPTTSGTYGLMLFNPTGDGAIYLNLQFSSAPSFSTDAGTLGTVYEFNATSTNISASGDVPLTYSLFSGSLPPGVTLSSTGVLSGTTTATAVSSTYSFVIKVEDADLQETTRSFSLTIVPDVVTWVTPASNSTIAIAAGSNYSTNLSAISAAGKTVTYEAANLPAGFTLSNGVLSGEYTGTNTIETSTLTAIANDTLKQAVSNITWSIVFGDLFFDYVTTLISASTATTNQPVNNNVFIDNSTNNLLITRNGNATQGTFSPYGENWSTYFDGTGDYLTSPSNAAFAFGTGDFTVEAWVYPVTGISSTAGFIATNTTTVAGVSLSRDLGWIGTSTITTGFNWSSNIVDNTWNHLAITRSGTTVRWFVNGILVSTQTNSSNLSSSSCAVGQRYSVGGTTMLGYISNARIIKGTALYTATFTLSTVPLLPIAGTSLLTCKDPNIVDDSANRFTITRIGDVSVQKFGPFAGTTLPTPYYSNYFDGSGDYFTLPSNQTQFTMGTGDFTVEMWVYVTSLAAARTLYDTMNAGDSTGTGRFAIQLTTGGVIQIFTLAGTILTSGGTVTVGSWNHIAYSRNSSSGRLYLNGAQVNTTYTDNNNYVVGNSNRPVIGVNAFNNSNNPMLGYISDLRVVKGTAVYTANFTPPTAPLTAIAGTSLLTCQSNTFIDNSTNNFAITAAGNTIPSQFAPFDVTYSTGQSYTSSVFGGSSYFDGTGDSLETQNLVVLTPSSIFTAECWVYNLGFSGSQYGRGIFSLVDATNTDRILVRLSASSNVVNLYGAVAGTGTFGASGVNSSPLTATPMTWTHVALVKQGSSFVLYLNGVAAITTTSAANFGNIRRVRIGVSTDGTVPNFNGYISDFRYVNGTAVYTSQFVPQNTPITPIQNTALLVNGTNAGVYDSSMMSTYETVGDAKIDTAVVKFAGTNSIKFDGTGDYVVVPSSINYGYGTGDFTIEFWVYFNTVSSDQTILSNLTSASSINPHIYLGGTNNTIRYFTNSVDRIVSSALSTNTWYHIAVSRVAGSTRMFINGTQSGSTYADSNNYGTSAPLGIGTYYSAGVPITTQTLNGYVSDVRITKGIARYTANFVAPTSVNIAE